MGKAQPAHHQHPANNGGHAFALPTLQIQIVVRRSRSLRNLENQTRRRRMREQPAFGIGDARFGGGGAAADAERLAFGADGAGILGHALDEGNHAPNEFGASAAPVRHCERSEAIQLVEKAGLLRR